MALCQMNHFAISPATEDCPRGGLREAAVTEPPKAASPLVTEAGWREIAPPAPSQTLFLFPWTQNNLTCGVIFICFVICILVRVMKKFSQKQSGQIAEIIGAMARVLLLVWRVSPGKATILVVIEIILALIPIAIAYFSGQLITDIVEAVKTGSPEGIYVSFAWVSILGVGMASLWPITSLLTSQLRYEIETAVTRQLMEKFARLSVAQRESKDVSDLFEKAETYTHRANWVFTWVLNLAADIIQVAGSLVALIVVSPWLGLIILLSLIPGFALRMRTEGKERRRWTHNSVSRRIAQEYSRPLRNMNSIMDVRLAGLEPLFFKRWREYFTKDQREIITAEREVVPFSLASNIFEGIVTAGVLWWGVLQIIAGSLPIGYFVTLERLVSNTQRSMRGIMYFFANSLQDILNTRDYYHFLALPEEIITGTKKVSELPTIEFKNVWFRYPNTSKDVLKNVSFTIMPGQDIALVGENGSGKSTIIKLLLGFYQPTKGQIFIDDVLLSDIDLTFWYKRIGVLFQDFERFAFTTLEDNIWFGDITQKKDKKKLELALEKADIATLPDTLSHGFSSHLMKGIDDDNGTDLSGGQWQRVALARNFFRSAPILILDEPTSAVDARAEFEIFEHIKTQQKDKTTIIISHRFSTVRKAQQIIVIDKGVIVEQGTHDELMTHNDGQYKKLFELQAEGYL